MCRGDGTLTQPATEREENGHEEGAERCMCIHIVLQIYDVRYTNVLLLSCGMGNDD
jgi:hypothetical protein